MLKLERFSFCNVLLLVILVVEKKILKLLILCSLFFNYSPLESDIFTPLNNFNFPSLRILYSKFYRNYPSGSEEEIIKCGKLKKYINLQTGKRTGGQIFIRITHVISGKLTNPMLLVYAYVNIEWESDFKVSLDFLRKG